MDDAGGAGGRGGEALRRRRRGHRAPALRGGGVRGGGPGPRGSGLPPGRRGPFSPVSPGDTGADGGGRSDGHSPWSSPRTRRDGGDGAALCGVPEEVGGPDADVGRGHRRHRSELVVGAGRRHAVDRAPPRAGRKPRPPGGSGRPARARRADGRRRLLDEGRTLHHRGARPRGRRHSHPSPGREGLRGPLPPGAGLAPALPHQALPAGVAAVPVRGARLVGGLLGAGVHRRPDRVRPRVPLPRPRELDHPLAGGSGQ